jgi:hypothetical protein
VPCRRLKKVEVLYQQFAIGCSRGSRALAHADAREASQPSVVPLRDLARVVRCTVSALEPATGLRSPPTWPWAEQCFSPRRALAGRVFPGQVITNRSGRRAVEWISAREAWPRWRLPLAEIAKPWHPIVLPFPSLSLRWRQRRAGDSTTAADNRQWGAAAARATLVRASEAAAARRAIRPAKPEIAMPYLAGQDLSGGKLTEANQWHGPGFVKVH